MSQKGQRGAAETADMGGTHGTPSGSLDLHGITPSGDVYWNLEATAVSYTHLTLPTILRV